MPHVLERAPTGRAKCRGCDQRIGAGEVRFGERLPNPYGEGEGEMTHWFHVTCGVYRRPAEFLAALEATTDDVLSSDARAPLDAAARSGVAHERLARVSAASRAPSGRATCRSCKALIDKDAWRIALVYYEDGRFMPSGFIHSRCAVAYFETGDVLPPLTHFSPGLTAADLDELRQEISP